VNAGPARDDVPEVRVEFYAGHRADLEPWRFRIGRREVAVAVIFDRWMEPGHSCFRVLGDDHRAYILCHDTVADRWDLVLGPDRGCRQALFEPPVR